MFKAMKVYLAAFLLLVLETDRSHQACTVTGPGSRECLQTPLNSNSLASVPSETTVLSFRRGPVDTEVAAGTFSRFRDLRTLYLSFDNIRALRPNCFSGLDNLQALHLTGNDIEAVPANVFDDCPELKKLSLRLNRIETVDEHAFDDMERLEELDLSSNQLSAVPELARLRSLKVLNLAYNRLTTLESDPFSALGRLEELVLSDNQLDSLAPSIFVGLNNLRTLNVKSNYLTDLDAQAILRSAGNLETVALSLNDFSCTDLRSLMEEFRRNYVTVEAGVSKATNQVNGIACRL